MRYLYIAIGCVIAAALFYWLGWRDTTSQCVAVFTGTIFGRILEDTVKWWKLR